VKRFTCTTCGGDSFSANEQSELPCPYCNAPKYKPSWQVTNEIISNVRSLFDKAKP
jgi:hypothetical protein